VSVSTLKWLKEDGQSLQWLKEDGQALQWLNEEGKKDNGLQSPT
jgi:hypothetical protein